MIFFVSIAIFMILVFLLAISLSNILKKRGRAELAEYHLKNAYSNRYRYIASCIEKSKELESLIKDALKQNDLKKVKTINDEISIAIDSMQLENKEKTLELETAIKRDIKEYNKAVDAFNKSAFSALNRFASRVCKLKRMEKI